MTADLRTMLDRPLPNLAEWLGDGVRAAGFEEWVQVALLAQETVDSERGRVALRLLKTFAIAAVEGGRIETERHGTAYELAAVLMARAAGAAVMTAVLSIVRQNDDVPLMKIARLLADDFAAGAKAMIKEAREVK